jgi:hypothetical protein
MALAGAATLTGLSMVPGMGLLTGGLTTIGGSVAKKLVGSSIGGVKNITSSFVKGGGALKSLAQNYQSKFKNGLKKGT